MKAAKIIEEREAYKEGRLQIAEGEATGFEGRAYKQSKDVTRTRLYLDAINEILPKVKKYIISDSSAPYLYFNLEIIQ